MTFTESELEAEWQVEYQTRIGMMANADKPTTEQRMIAVRIANEHISRIEAESGVHCSICDGGNPWHDGPHHPKLT